MAEELTSIYRRIAEGNGKQYELLFSIVGMFSSVMEFDPVTDDPLPSTIDDVLYGIASFDIKKIAWQNDRLQHIVNFASVAIRNLIEALHEKNLREHLITRPEKIREIDSKSMMWLSKKPGFTVKQKIASEQRMMGVFHTTSLDTAENRLFKSFMKDLDDLLLEKENACAKREVCVSDEFKRFVMMVHSWLKSDEAEAIGPWRNTPPNNTLLNDKNYRKIWKAHLMLQNLNEQVEFDLNRLRELTASCYFWLKAALLNQSDKIRFKQNVLIPDYKNLLLVKNGDLLEYLYNKKIWQSARAVLDVTKLPEKRETYADVLDCAQQSYKAFLGDIPALESFKSNDEQVSRKINAVASVDLNSVRPSYHIDDGKTGLFSKKLIYQEVGKYPCSSAKSKWISTKLDKVKTFSIHSIFDETLRSAIDDEEDSRNAVARACSDFAKNLKDEFPCQKCIYITNDDVDDFSPSVNVFKRCMNSAFSNAEILPRSIAVLFSKLGDLQKRFHPDDKIYIRVIHDDYEIKTVVRIAYDDKLAKKNPKTKGWFFERLGYSRISGSVQRQKNVPQNMERTLTAWDATLLKNAFSVDKFHFEWGSSFARVDARNNEIVVDASCDASMGGIVYDRLQNVSPDIPLWCDVLPKLNMMDSNGEHVLVESGKVRVRPVVGKPVSIPISWNFIFPKGKPFYEFPLEQGNKKSVAKYYAYISDSSFPLEQDETCRLHLTYTYGVPLPYNLEFISVSDKPSFRSVTVKWENKSHKDYVHDMPVPNFVREYTWADMHHVSKKNSEETSDLIESWLPTEYKKIDNSGIFTITGSAHSKFEDTNVFFIQVDFETNAICYIEAKYPAGIGDQVWGYIRNVPRGLQLLDPHVIGGSPKACEFMKSLRFPAIVVWNNGRSIKDSECPDSFRKQTENVCDKLKKMLPNKNIPKCVIDEFMHFLSCMHKDVPDWFYPYFTHILDNINLNTTSWIAYALGDCSMDWQKELLAKVINLSGQMNKSIYAIRIMAIAMWRVNGFVYELDEKNVKTIIKSIRNSINWMSIANKEEQEKYKSQRRLLYTACLECLVALCRLRKTRDGKSTGEKMLATLSPSSNPDVKFIVNKIKEVNAQIKSFLSFNIERPVGDSTPELLYAAYGYLSGNIDSNSIKVLEADFGD
ncbi:DUF2357 domain-containing protein [uncultured Fibrobacter sp.]|uniref:DUF2357 domain-containing protein n=1 Tax=uncultured Fibrobacter sp. TaxID=261512 RepID=UPI0025F05F89|nr:DUF2357 domain-containing protein [uncultured Fibrobacter sp.]